MNQTFYAPCKVTLSTILFTYLRHRSVLKNESTKKKPHMQTNKTHKKNQNKTPQPTEKSSLPQV